MGPAHAHHRRQPSRGADARAPRHRRCRGQDQDPRQVPPRPRERGVRDAARADVRQDVPADLRGGARPRSAGPRRGVPRDLRAARGDGAAAAARPDGGGARPAPGRPAPRPPGGDSRRRRCGDRRARGDRAGQRGRRRLRQAERVDDRGQQAQAEAEEAEGEGDAGSADGRAADRARQPDLRVPRHRRRLAHQVRGDPRRAAHVPRGQAAAREPRQDRRPTDREREARLGSARPGAGRIHLHADHHQAARARRPPLRLMPARAGIVVSGTEVLTGRVRDRNGPWLSDRLLELGVDLAHITICGDRPEDMTAQLRFMADQGADLVITSGGLGPTADDLTIETVARFSGRELFLDEALEERIAEILRPLMKRFRNLDFDAVRAANRKQALVPEGAHVIYPAGTAPGLVVPGKPTIVVLPGPPRELHAMWPEAVETEAFQEASGGRTEYEQTTMRLFGIPESEIAETLRVAEREVEGFEDVEITTCLRRGEVEVVARREPSAEEAWQGIADLIAARHARSLFSTDGSTIDEQVASLLDGHRVAVGESCTGGLMAARLTERAGSSAYVAGGAVAYSNEAKAELLAVDPALIERHGAVSPEVARAMADGALERFEADIAVSITGVAGPGGGREAGRGGGSEEKRVGYVCWCVKERSGATLARDVRLPGDRTEIRDRSTTV